MSKKPRKSVKSTLSFYWQFVRNYPYTLTGIIIILPITIIFNQFLPPLILANALRRLSNGDYIKDQPWQSFQSEIIMYIAIILIGSLVLWRLIDILVWRLEGRVLKDISQRIFGHLITQSADFHANNFGGSLVSHTNKTLGAYVRMADTLWFNTLPLVISVAAAGVILWPKASLYVICLIVLSVLYVVVSAIVSKPVRERGAIHASAESKQTGYLADAITNVMAIKGFSGEKREKDQFDKINVNTHRKLIDVMFAHQRQMLYFGSMTSLISISAFILAIVSVVSFGADIATMFLILSYTTNIGTQLFQFSNNALRNYNRAIGDSAEMIHIIGTPSEVQDPERPAKVRMNRGEIVFKDVTFAHKDAGSNIFNKLSLKIKPGEKVGLVGHSGSGKTSLSRLLLRFSDLDGGQITIDGQDIASVTQADLRRSISYVPQEPLLFHRSIEENISYGRPGASAQEVRAFARMAHADDFIKSLPKGYETLVGERGVKLSGGQRQRVAIARAMLKNAPILVLDEATSALDSESEALIQDALWKLMDGRTAIVIAHRLSTIQRMDRIIVLDDGKIVEEGGHKDLLYKKGIYAKLWKHQSGGFLED
jgi:ATP-binding cassette, subfamily B, bacterial